MPNRPRLWNTHLSYGKTINVIWPKIIEVASGGVSRIIRTPPCQLGVGGPICRGYGSVLRNMYAGILLIVSPRLAPIVLFGLFSPRPSKWSFSPAYINEMAVSAYLRRSYQVVGSSFSELRHWHRSLAVANFLDIYCREDKLRGTIRPLSDGFRLGIHI